MRTFKAGGRVLAASVLLLSGPLPVTAWAQETADNSLSIEEIVVTARKRSESLQDTPIAISAFGTEEMKAAGYENIIDVSKAAPGLFIEPINGANAKVNTSPRFRGIVFDSSSPLQRTSSIFIDGILVSGGIQTIGVQNLERVEIIKGPQSALFGRNTFSGAINYVTKDPAEELEIGLSVLGASRDEYRIAASIEGPITPWLGGRLEGSYADQEGHYDNANVDGQTLGDEQSWNFGGSLLFTPNDRLRIKVRGSVYEDNDGPAAFVRQAGFSDHNFGGFPLPGGGTTETAFRGTIGAPRNSEIALDTSQLEFDNIIAALRADPRSSGNDTGTINLDYEDLGGAGLVREGYRAATTISFDLNDNLNLSFLAGYNEDEWLIATDFDASPGGGFFTTGAQQVEDLSFEGRLSGAFSNDRFRWSVGANYVDIEVTGSGGFWDPILGFWFPGVFADPAETSAETIGAFATLDVDLTDKLTLILEGRYQEDEIAEPAVNASLPSPISPATFYSFLPRVLLQYQVTDNAMVYASFSEGNLPGGFNEEVGELDAAQLAEFAIENPGVGTTFLEETLTNYELGLKQTAFDGRLAFNVAAFFMEREDQIFSGFQIVADPTNVNGVRTVAFTDNGATSEIFGVELDGTFVVNENFTVQGSLAWIDAQIESFPAGSNAGDFTAVFGPDADPQGQQAPRFPEWSGSLSGIYEKPTSAFGGSDFFVRTDAFYTGTFYDEVTNLAEIESAVEINLRTGFRLDNLTIELFVTNLTDEDAPIGGNNIADTGVDVRFSPGGLFDFSQESVHVALRDKRQVGLRLDMRF